MGEKENRRGKLGRWLLIAAAVVVLAGAAVVAAAPFLLTHIPIPQLEFDLSPCLKGKAAELVDCKRVTAAVEIRRDQPDGFRVLARGKLLDWPYSASAHVGFGFVRAEGDLSLTLDDTDWKAYVTFGVRGRHDWNFAAKVPATRVDQDNALLASVVARALPPSVSNLVFSGTFRLDANGKSTPSCPVPAWTARCALADVDATLELGGKPTRIDGLKVRFGADGIAGHRDIAPLSPHADAVEFAGFTLSNVYANVRATERSYLVTEAGAKCCGGDLKLYSLFLDPKSLNAGATVFVDGVDAGQILSHISAFHGEATGRLHGKLPFFLKGSGELTLRDAYLFSTPGETGKVRIVDAAPVLANLALAGLPESQRSNLAKALADLDYTVLKLEFRHGSGGEVPELPLKLEGTATRGGTTVPVNINVTFRGDLDKIINTGMKIRRHTK